MSNVNINTLNYINSFEVLLKEEKLSDNLFKNCYDITLDFQMKSNFIRNIEGEGISQVFDKLSLVLRGSGDLKLKPGNNNYYIISSKFINLDGRIKLFKFNKNSNITKIFQQFKEIKLEEMGIEYLDDNIYETESFLPCIKCIVTSFAYYDFKSQWVLKLEEI